MKKILILLTAVIIVLSSCSRRHHSYRVVNLPPGQAKKLTGSKSAKPYAPGQRKKVVRKN